MYPLAANQVPELDTRSSIGQFSGWKLDNYVAAGPFTVEVYSVKQKNGKYLWEARLLPVKQRFKIREKTRESAEQRVKDVFSQQDIPFSVVLDTPSGVELKSWEN